ncbi:Aste57867_5859 [Aphanomyces stellatus]|uniref:Aste57867_5859 protein n=1 Tax=Aphanomyces stellatus TaxID=120398 RepID=A0A485KE19_9STRA|nr:hypothetical protein As57867_005845 [Aphanomyces stellatus]VFT82882.1 Aste57867_5859 [Aphanomyces stellatus]
MWEAYVVAAEEGVALLVSLYILATHPPHQHEAYASPYAFRTPPSGFKRLFHVFCIVYFTLVQTVDIVHSHGHCVFFYTTWNYVAQIFFWCWSLADRKGVSRLRLVLFDVLFPVSIFVVIVVWGILLPMAMHTHEEALLLNWVSFSQHGINTVLLLVDGLWSDSRAVAWSTGALSVLWPLIYCIFAWIVHNASAQGFWPYPFLAIDHPDAPLWYLMLVLGQVLIFWFTWGIASMRVRAASHKRVDTEALTQLLDVTA